jgi:hypothetical protein
VWRSWTHPRFIDGLDLRQDVPDLRLAESGAGRVVSLDHDAALVSDGEVLESRLVRRQCLCPLELEFRADVYAVWSDSNLATALSHGISGFSKIVAASQSMSPSGISAASAAAMASAEMAFKDFFTRSSANARR